MYGANGKRLRRRRPVRAVRPRGRRSSGSPSTARTTSTAASWRGRSRATCASTAARSRSRDLSEYRVIRRRPVRVSFIGHEFGSNPPPSTGGVLIGLGLRLLDRLGPGGPPGSAEAMAQLIEIMREQDDGAGRAVHPRALPRRARASACRRGISVRGGRAASRGACRSCSAGTTHIAVVDGRGNAASLTASTGAGSGVVVPGTGHPAEQHARRVRPGCDGSAPAARRPFDEHDGALGRAARGPPAARRRQRRVAAAARRDHADRHQRGRARLRRAGGDRAAARPSRGAASTSRAGTTPPRSTGSSRSATSSCAGGAGTSSSAARRGSSCWRTGRSPRPGTPGAGATASWSRELRDPRGDARRCRRARRARTRGQLGARGLAADSRRMAQRGR